MKTIVQLSVVAIISSFLTVFMYSRWWQPTPQVIVENVQPVATSVVEELPTRSGSTTSGLPSTGGTDFITAAKVSTPAVVFITSLQTIDYNFWMGERIGQASGSGVIISQDGYIVTNNHVVENAKDVKVVLNDNREFKAEVIGTDPTTDLALLQIEASGLEHLNFGDSDNLQIGEWVLAVGNPLRLESTVTAGIVSAMGRDINILNGQQYSIESFIQTDAVVNPGNSGGALVNTSGELIGINTAIITRSGNFEGYSFAVPSNLVKKVVNDLKEFGNVQRGLIGVRISEVTNEMAQDLNLPDVSGVYINSVFPGGAADEGNLKINDVIVAINDVNTATVPKLQEQIGRLRPGEIVTVDYFRSGKKYTTELTLKNQLNSTELLTVRRDGILKELGLEIRDLSASEAARIEAQGIKVVSINRGSVIDQTNMIPDYIITHVNGEEVSTADEFVAKLETLKGKIMLEGFYEKYQGEFPYSFHRE